MQAQATYNLFKLETVLMTSERLKINVNRQTCFLCFFVPVLLFCDYNHNHRFLYYC